MIKPDKKPKIDSEELAENGNAFAIMSTVAKALREAGADREYINKYHKESMAGDYDNLLRVVMEYVDVK